MFEWTEERVSFMADACERTDFHEKLAALLAPYLKRTDSVCDAGCGLGYLSLALSPLVGHVTAAERDDRALDVLRRQLARRHIRNVTPLCTDVLAYTPSEPFDAMVFCFFGSMEEIVAAADVARRAKADLDLVLAGLLKLEEVVERHDTVNLRERHRKTLRDLDRNVARNVSVSLLHLVQNHDQVAGLRLPLFDEGRNLGRHLLDRFVHSMFPFDLKAIYISIEIIPLKRSISPH